MKQTTLHGKTLPRARSGLYILKGLKKKPALNQLIVRRASELRKLADMPRGDRTYVAASEQVPSIAQYDKNAYAKVDVLAIRKENIEEYHGLDPWFNSLSFSHVVRFKPASPGRVAKIRQLEAERGGPTDDDDYYTGRNGETLTVAAVHFSAPCIEYVFQKKEHALSLIDVERKVFCERAVCFVQVGLKMVKGKRQPVAVFFRTYYAPDDDGFTCGDLLEALRRFTAADAEYCRQHGTGWSPDHCIFEGIKECGRDEHGILMFEPRWGS